LLAPVPETATLERFKVVAPVLVRITVCALLVVPTVWIEKIKPAGAKLTADPAATPVPAKVTVFGPSGTLSEILRLPLRVPAAVGVKTTLTVQFFPAATLVPQLLVCVKSPLAAILEIFSVALPLLVRITVCAALVVPTGCLPNVRVVKFRETATAEKGTRAVLPPPPQEVTKMAIKAKAVASVFQNP
jgi:hypothetical protein